MFIENSNFDITKYFKTNNFMWNFLGIFPQKREVEMEKANEILTLFSTYTMLSVFSHIFMNT